MADTLPPLPDGFTLDTPAYGSPRPGAAASAPATPVPSNLPALPQGFTLDQHPAAAMAAPVDQSGDNPYLANAVTGLQKSGPALMGLPNTLGKLGDWAIKKTGLDGVIPTGMVAAHTYSPEEIDKALYDANNAVARTVGLPEAQPYRPSTTAGKVAQDILAGAPLALVGGGGIPAMITRQLANAAGATAGDVAQQAYPDSPGVALAASLLGGAAGGAALPTVAAGGRVLNDLGGKIFNTPGAVRKATAAALVNGASESKTAPDLINAIDQGMPQWNIPGNQVQPAPTLATVTMDPGLAGMTYRDMTAAETRNNPVYRLNSSQTNTAQREAVGNVTPPGNAAQLAQAQTDLQAQSGALPAGITAQNAGAQFRSGLQSIYDQRVQNRQNIGSNVFDQLDTSPAQISLSPIKDYATTQAAQNAGEVGVAYQRAARQFLSGTGIQLDTAPFANSVLKGLNDLAQSYPAGSAAARAVLDVKNRAEQSIFTQAPEIAAARQVYAQASQPLDVFNPSVTPGPIANAVQTTRFGGYTVPNDSVLSSFLTGKGGPDAIDRLNSVFPDVKSATQSLQDYIASQVQSRAVNPDGSINSTALQSVLRPYAPVLAKGPFSGLAKQFSDLSSAQSAVDQLAARQKLFDKFNEGLGLQARDMNGVPMYSAKQFGDFLDQNRPAVAAAYGQPGMTRLDQIRKQLDDAAQIMQARVKGTSGTAQSMPKGPENVLGYLIGQAASESGGDLAGAALHGIAGTLVGGSLGKLTGIVTMGQLNRFNTKVASMLTDALSDPNYARSLLTNYNPRQVRPIGQRALNYVKNRLSGVVAPAITTAQ
jgi:hypothetical protein